MKMAQLGLALFATSFPWTSALATIIVRPGVYDVPALVVRYNHDTAAVFNLRTRSELKILLQGDRVKKLPKRLAMGLHVKIRVLNQIDSDRGSALLLDFKDLGQEKIPRVVGNDLKLLKK